MINRRRQRPPAKRNDYNRCFCVASVVILCCFFFELGAWQMGGSRGDHIHKAILHRIAGCSGDDPPLTLEFVSHGRLGHLDNLHLSDEEEEEEEEEEREKEVVDLFPSCSHEKTRRCLVPTPRGYLTPFPWPKSREFVPISNVGPTSIPGAHLDGELLVFPPGGIEGYLDEIASVVPFHDGTVRTALDLSCGVASLGAYLMDRDVVVMSISHSPGADARLPLERGVPAVLASSPANLRLPYPSRSFDMVHCSHAPVPWTSDDGMHMMEIDRLLRPGGYWILSGPPINWQVSNDTKEQSKEELEKEQKGIEAIAKLLCWEKEYHKGDLAIWRKGINDASCPSKAGGSSVEICNLSEVTDIWNKKMAACIAPYPKVGRSKDVAGGQLKQFPKRLFAVPPIIAHGHDVPGISAKNYTEDSELWKNYVSTYKNLNNLVGTTRYRNIMDMNADLGSFAAALESPYSWVMNVVPTVSVKDTLGIIYERGLIGIYHDWLFTHIYALRPGTWCKAFSTYPRAYDLIHASGLFSLYRDKCEIEDMLLEMDRILRPEGTVIFRDDVDVLMKVKSMARRMRWDTKMSDHEDGAQAHQKILMAVKRFWVVDTAANTKS